jgi:tetratricopeptide (TPR) repeat protein
MEGYAMKPGKMNQPPLEAQYLYRQGLFLSSEGKKEPALRSLKMAVTIAPRYCDAYNAMGNCLDELGRYEEAIRKYEKVLEIDPGHAEARFKRDILRTRVLQGNDQAHPGHYDPLMKETDEKRFFSCLLFSFEVC